MIHSFLLIGQSNMAGRGFLNEAVPVDNTNVYVLRNGRFHHLFRPVHNDRSFSGVCLAESFAERYAKTYGVSVGLIPCADGGTALNQWMPGEILFDHAVAQAKLAMRSSKIVGILWHQGEADCGETLYPTYGARFEEMMAAFRKELDLPDVPFLVGGLGDFLAKCSLSDKLKNYSFVNEALREIAAHHPRVGFVSAEGLGANPDHLHFHAKALHEFGLRYFEEFCRLMGEEIVPKIDTDAAEPIRTEMEML